MGGNAARALLPALVVLALVGVVAIAATGSTPSGDGDSRPPSGTIIDTILSLGMVALIPAALIFVYGLMQRDAIKQEIALRKYRRFSFITFVLVFAAFTAVMSYGLSVYRSRGTVDELGEQGFPGDGLAPVNPSNTPDVEPHQPEFAWIPVLVVVGLVALAVAAYFVSRRRAAPPRAAVDVAREIADVMDDSLDALRAETDPRRAVIAAYARLERVLAAHGLPRQDAETPNEYLARILVGLDVESRSVRRLTDLFSEAKFSRHMVDATMKEEAIDALSTVRDELRARHEAEQAAPEPPVRTEVDAERGTT